MKHRSNLGPLRWLVLPVIACDTLMTLLGQPESYWRSPATADEGNPFFAWFLVRGETFFVATSVCYIAAAFLLTTILPRRIALVVLLAYVFGHYLGASTWMLYKFNLGMSVPILYGTAIAIAMVWLGLDLKRPNLPPRRNAGSRPSSDDSPATEAPSSHGPRGCSESFGDTGAGTSVSSNFSRL